MESTLKKKLIEVALTAEEVAAFGEETQRALATFGAGWGRAQGTSPRENTGNA
ncbi:MAG: hypothetical protein AB1806_15510 [Acidobacteriota bacterium]